MRALSISAIRDYKKYSKRHNYVDIDVIKARINSYIDSSEHITPIIGGTLYQFGSCKIKVDVNNIVISIKYSDIPIKATESETEKMNYYFKKYGLDSTGTKLKRRYRKDKNLLEKRD